MLWETVTIVATPINFVGVSSFVTFPLTGQVSITVPEIDNPSYTWTTGNIEVVLWYTNAPYVGGNIVGHIAATIPYTNVLGPNNFFTASVNVEPFYPISGASSYCATLALEEFDGSSYVIMDHINYSGFNPPIATPTPLPVPTPTPTPTPMPTPTPTPTSLSGSGHFQIVDTTHSFAVSDFLSLQPIPRTNSSRL
jgi:hypothetical protein